MSQPKIIGALISAALVLGVGALLVGPRGSTEHTEQAGNAATPTVFEVSPTAGTPDITGMETALAANDLETFNMLAREMDAYLAQNNLESYKQITYDGARADPPDMDMIEMELGGNVVSRRSAASRLHASNAHVGGQRALAAVINCLNDTDPEVRLHAAGAAGIALGNEAIATTVAPTPVSFSLGSQVWASSEALADASISALENGDDDLALSVAAYYGRLVQVEGSEEVIVQRYNQTTDLGLKTLLVDLLGRNGADSSVAQAIYEQARESSDLTLKTTGADATARALGETARPILEAMLAAETDPDIQQVIQRTIHLFLDQ